MRTGPFSSSKVIDRLNSSFVPVYVVNEDYRDNGPAPKEERAEMTRVYREALASGFSAGTVHVYLLAPDGKTIAGMHVAEAAQTPKLVELLDKWITLLNVKPGKPLVAPVPQSVAPKCDPGSMTLHLVARPLSGGGSWGGVSEDWIIYTPDEIKGWLPTTKGRTGQTWRPDAALVTRTFLHIYPVTENNDVLKNSVQQQELTATLLSVSNGIARARLDGRLRMSHWF
ncbi:MAG: hypothetical protein ABJA67_07485, partial [Chthonomonadales bacterium]